MSNVGGISSDYLRGCVERIERLEEEKTTLLADIRDVYAEAKGNGFDAKIMRQIVRLRKLDKFELEEQEMLLDLYKNALGMLVGTPLGEAAIRREAQIRDIAFSHGITNEAVIGEVIKGTMARLV